MPGAVHRQHLEEFANELDVSYAYVNEMATETVDRLQNSIEETTNAFKDLFGDSPILQRIPVVIRKRCKRAIKDSI